MTSWQLQVYVRRRCEEIELIQAVSGRDVERLRPQQHQRPQQPQQPPDYIGDTGEQIPHIRYGTADLPPGWEWAGLRDITENLDSRRVPVSSAERTKRAGKVPYYGATGRVGWIDFPLFDEDLLLLGEDGVSFFDPLRTKAYLISGPSWVNNHAHVLRVVDEVADHRYLCDYLNWMNYAGIVNGTTRLKLTQKAMNRIVVPLPPLAEQRRIVTAIERELSRLDAASTTLAACGHRVETLSAAVLSHAVNASLDTAGEGRGTGGEWAAPLSGHQRGQSMSQTPVEAVDVDGYTLPRGWEILSLSQISREWGYGTSTRCDYSGTGAPVLRIPNVQRGEIDVIDLKYAVDGNTDLSGYMVEPGDVLFVRTNGSRNLIGRVAVVRQASGAAFASYLIRFRLIPGGVPADWIRIVFSSPLWRRHIERVASSSAGQFNLNSKTLGSIPVPLPPRELLPDVMSRVDRYSSVANSVAETLVSAGRRSKTLHRSILTEAFTGRLVAQNPDDEPASVSLARIRTRRNSTGTGTGTGTAARPARPTRRAAGTG